MTASKYGLGNVTIIVDRNHLQYDGDTEKVMPLSLFSNKWRSFGCEVEEINGHNLTECYNALMKRTSMPRVVIADTIKGKGISFMENVPGWHFGRMTAEQVAAVLESPDRQKAGPTAPAQGLCLMSVDYD